MSVGSHVHTLLLVTTLVGCESWPRYTHLPDPGLVTAGDVDPHTLVEVQWRSLDVDGADQPPGADLGELQPGDAWMLISQLDGAGWDDVAEPEVLSDPECGSTATRAPIPGDYRADVDIWRFRVASTGRLCVEGGVGDANVGVDMLLARLDACGIPGPWVVDASDAEPYGFADTGPRPGWWLDLEEPGDYAVLLASYAPNSEAALPYRLGVALRSPDAPLCPILPGEVSR